MSRLLEDRPGTRLVGSPLQADYMKTHDGHGRLLRTAVTGFGLFVAVQVIVGLALLGIVGYVVVHFVSKFW